MVVRSCPNLSNNCILFSNMLFAGEVVTLDVEINLSSPLILSSLFLALSLVRGMCGDRQVELHHLAPSGMHEPIDDSFALPLRPRDYHQDITKY